MKELSIEEKAKRYNESIKRAKDINREHSERGFKPSEDVLYIFPELAESEEEKLSKKLHECVCRAINNDKLPYEERKYISEQVIPYLENLEKQKEQEPTSSKQCADYYNENSELKMPRLTDFENEIAQILFEREYDGSTETDDDIARGRLEYELAAISLAPKLLDLAIKEKKSTWSEGDEVMLRKIIQYIISLSEGCEVDLNDQINWLKSLKDRMALTNKNDFDRGYDVGISAAKFNQWKPTEEQMDALRDAVSGFPITDTDAIYSLYNDLKKL